jgi:murein DD-endopeptidase MepM/ murein hydrolase activator NlpD
MPTTRTTRTGMALVVVVGSIVAPAYHAFGAGTGSSPPSDPRALDQQRRQLEQRSADVDSQMSALLTSYEDTQTNQATLDAEVADLDARITSTTNDLQAAEAALTEAGAKVSAGEQRVAAARGRFDEATEALQAHALASYMGDGPLAMVSGVVKRADVDLLVAVQYARLVADVQQQHVDDYAADRDTLTRERDALTAARAGADENRKQIANAKADLESQRTEKAARQQEVAQNVAEQAQLVQQLSARKATYQSEIDNLQQESAQIAALLRQRMLSAASATTRPATVTTAPKAASPKTSAPKTSAPKTTAPTPAAPKPAAPKPVAPVTTAPKTASTAKPVAPVTTPKPATTASTRPASTPTIAPPAAGPGFRWPLPGAPMVSGFGMRVQPVTGVYQLHAGVDIWAPEGTAIHAAAAGVVVSVGVHHGYGNAVIIDHCGGWGTVYAHQSQTAATVGQRVGAGDVIGYVGHTGLAAGPHLHFEIRVNGDPVDPMRYVHP